MRGSVPEYECTLLAPLSSQTLIVRVRRVTDEVLVLDIFVSGKYMNYNGQHEHAFLSVPNTPMLDPACQLTWSQSVSSGRMKLVIAYSKDYLVKIPFIL